jgi:hypothetical protein
MRAGVSFFGAGARRWLGSSLTVDRAASRLLLHRVSAWKLDGEGPRIISLDRIDAVVLTPQRRMQLLLPNRIELRLTDGEKVPVSTVVSQMKGVAIQGKRIAEAIDCPYEEQEKPDKRNSRALSRRVGYCPAFLR